MFAFLSAFPKSLHCTDEAQQAETVLSAVLYIYIFIYLKRLLADTFLSNRRTAAHVIRVEIFHSITSSGRYMEYTREKQVMV